MCLTGRSIRFADEKMSEKDNNLAIWKMLKSDSYLFFKSNPCGKVCQSAVVKIFTKGSNEICGFAFNRKKKCSPFMVSGAAMKTT